VTPRWWPDARCAPLAYLTGWRVPRDALALTDEPGVVEVFFELENITQRHSHAELESPTQAVLAHLEWIVSRLNGVSVTQIQRVAQHLSPAALRLLFILERVQGERGEVLGVIAARARWMYEQYTRKPLHKRQMERIGPELRATAERHGHSAQEEFSEQVTNALWIELWSPPQLSAPPDPDHFYPPRTPRELHSAIARAITEALLGPDPDRKREGREKLDHLLRVAARRSARLRARGRAAAADRLDDIVGEAQGLRRRKKRTGWALRAELEEATGMGPRPPLEQSLGEQQYGDLAALEAVTARAEADRETRPDLLATCWHDAPPRTRELMTAHLTLLQRDPKATVSDAARAVGMSPKTAHTHYERLGAKALARLRDQTVAL